MAAQAEKACAAILRRSQLGVPLRPVPDDVGNIRERLHIVDHGRPAVKTHHRREGRLDAGVASQALQGIQQSGLFAAFIGARPRMGAKLEIEPGAAQVLAEIAAAVGFRQRPIDNLEEVAILASNIDETLVSLDGIARDDNAFDELMRVILHQGAVFAGAGLALIRVAHHVLGLRRLLGDKTPFHARIEAGAAAAAQAGVLHLVDDVFRFHGQGFFQSLVPAMLQVDVNGRGVGQTEALADDLDLERAAGHRVFVARHERELRLDEIAQKPLGLVILSASLSS